MCHLMGTIASYPLSEVTNETLSIIASKELYTCGTAVKLSVLVPQSKQRHTTMPARYIDSKQYD